MKTAALAVLPVIAVFFLSAWGTYAWPTWKAATA